MIIYLVSSTSRIGMYQIKIRLNFPSRKLSKVERIMQDSYKDICMRKLHEKNVENENGAKFSVMK